MRFSALILASLAGLATANFDLYLGHQIIPVDGGVLHDGWYIFDNDPSKADVRSSPPSLLPTNHPPQVLAYGPYLSQDDVSGRTTGVRCVRSGCYGGAATDINVLEIHFSNNPLYHWTIYKDRGHPYKMYGLDGRTYGESSSSRASVSTT
ncbi:hypothetical protein QC761_0064940 [Podospora bellae-mahoneyi]|uniref:Uncharacterized protein n=1 Tax=Podospora bellae-mahoneyi TaxID=2093777 RepID=A0ABR0FGS7_9PEZI|nr:hypothetical protein QC761_0064940 [Podospora bellae-mahoneyi]